MPELGTGRMVRRLAEVAVLLDLLQPAIVFLPPYKSKSVPSWTQLWLVTPCQFDGLPPSVYRIEIEKSF